MDNGRNSYGVSFIQTSAGAMITGEIKRYATYKELMEETAPTRLASVSNASRDHEQYLRGEIDTDYNVPEDHVGGILYQRDFINSTWILLYTDSDLSIPTFVEWDNILHVPAWVGGVSNNRVKLVQNTYAVPRTTYYSFGNYRLVLPPANHVSVKLGDEIVLEQYENYGAVLYEHIDGEYSTSDQETVTVGGTIYNVYYTVPYYDFEVDPSNQDPVYGQPITACAYKFICTETDGGTRCWRPVLVKDNISALITDLRQRDTDHILADDPHPNYILKREARNYLWSDISVATEFNEGKVRLALQSDIDGNERGAVVVTPYLLKEYTTATFSVIGHTHSISEITSLQTELNNRSLVGHTHDAYSLKNHQHTVSDVTDLQTTLDSKQNVLANNGRYIEIENNIVNCTIPDASTQEKGIVKLVDSIPYNGEDAHETAVTPYSLGYILNLLNSLSEKITRLLPLTIGVSFEFIYGATGSSSSSMVGTIPVIRRWTSGSGAHNPVSRVTVTWTLPLSAIIDSSAQRFKCSGFYCEMQARGCTEHTVVFDDTTIIDYGTKTISNVLDNGSRVNWTINGSKVIDSTSTEGEGRNNHHVYLQLSYTAFAIVIKAEVYSDGEEDDNSWIVITYNEPGTLMHELL